MTFPKYAQIEWLTPQWMYRVFRIRVGVIRVWDREFEPGSENKMPYSWACTVHHISRDILEFKGVVKVPSSFHFRQIVKELKRLGYKTGKWVRIGENKQERIVEFSPSK